MADPPAPSLSLPSGDLLLAVDGEPHTEAAQRWALQLAAAAGRRVVAVHVEDPYLKQFHTEIYAQGRREYLEHVDECLARASGEIGAAFGAAADGLGVEHELRVLRGEPLEELAAEARRGGYCLMICGAKRITGLRRWQSDNLPDRLAALRDLPLLVVPT